MESSPPATTSGPRPFRIAESSLLLALAVGLGLLAGAARVTPAASLQDDAWSQRVRSTLWGDEDTARAALEQLRADPESAAASRMRFHDFEEIVREGPPLAPLESAAAPGGEAVAGRAGGPAAGSAAEPLAETATEFLVVTLPDGRRMGSFVQLPPGYGPNRPWPVMLAMHGGPPGSEAAAERSAGQMIRVWSEPASTFGWIVVSPVMSTVVSQGPRTEDRLPYEVLRPDQVEVLLAAVRSRYRVDPDRIVSTGISLGSNFSIGFAAADPDRFAAIVPVSTEGDARPALLANLRHVPVYVLEGSQDRNIRGINGPRELERILVEVGADLVYREFADRAHEGFQEHYADVLRWLASRLRDPWPRRFVRQPHNGIMGISRRAFWVETDTRQGYVAAEAEGNRITLEARWAREITLHLSDRLVDLDRPVEVVVNGEGVAILELERSIPTAIEAIRRHGDTGRIVAAVATVKVPPGSSPARPGAGLLAAGRQDGAAPGAVATSAGSGGSGEAGSRETAHAGQEARPLNPMARTEPWERLSFWEMYATRALFERFPTVGLEGDEVDVGAEDGTVGIRIDGVDADGPFGDAGLRAGDVLLEVGGEPFYPESGGLRFLHEWLVRELTARPAEYEVVVERQGERLELTARLALGPYRPPGPRRP